MEITSPSGKVYQWYGATPPSDSDIAALQQYESGLSPQELVSKHGAAPAPNGPIFRGHGAGGTWPQNGTPEAQLYDIQHGGGLSGNALMPMMPGAASLINALGTTLGTTIGATAGTAAEPGGGTVVGGGLGAAAGADLAQRANQALGFQKDYQLGQTVGAGIMGAIPGESLVGSGIGRVASSVAKHVAGNIASTTAQSLIDQGHLPTTQQVAIAATLGAAAPIAGKVMDSGSGMAAVAQKASPMAARDAAWSAAQREGIVVDPNAIKSSFPNRVLGSIGGKADLKAAASLKNGPLVNDLGVRAMGLPSGTPLDTNAINSALADAQAPYNAVRAISPDMDAAVDQLRILRYQAAKLQDQYENSVPGASLKRNPELEQPIRDANLAAANQQNWIAQQLTKMGQSGLAQKFASANVRLAKIGEVENAFDPETGWLSAQKLAARQTAGVPLTDELKTIAQIQKNFPDYVRTPNKIAPPGSNKLTPIVGAQMAYEGAKSAGPVGALAGLIPFADKTARSVALSPFWQRNMVNPSYGTPQPDFLANMARFGTMSATSPAYQTLQRFLQPVQ